MGNLATLKTAVESIVSSITSYTAMEHYHDISKNSSITNLTGKYGVRLNSTTESEGNGVLTYVTYRTPVEIKLLIGYAETQLSEDSNDTIVTLQEHLLNIYEQCVRTKCGASSIVVHSLDFSVTNIEILPDNNIVAVTASFDVIHRG